LLCRHHGCELAIPLYASYRFFNRDYSVFDCGGMAFSEAKVVGKNGFGGMILLRVLRKKSLRHWRKEWRGRRDSNSRPLP